ncbi:NAD(P)H-dependent oxidoreductase [Hydrogenophaga sp.]|uniref:NADPH-dependent FMN reductase n=1 Tax=Hydrogenophaga sp. TaxID=1904254 RepID=UPI002638358C|nr:NAD(P)H-dependent oxidoreductase [Hydrogenophaga sp.]MDM7951112.1 NAD(P)H-dependent oxidoreductase [Hydrogenophaga sp.]
MNTPIPLLVFSGSSRAQSLNRKLAHAAGEIAVAEGAQVTRLNLADFDLPIYNGDLEAQGMPRDVVRLKEVLHAHPAWIISAPEYNGSYPALLKNAIDWASRPMAGDPAWAVGTKPFAGKVVGLLAAAPGALGGVRGLLHLAPLLMQLQCWVAPKQFALAKAGEAFDPSGALSTEAVRVAVHGVVEQVLWAARRFQS